MSDILELVEKSQEESALNNKKALHNASATLDEIQPYENTALTELIDAVSKLNYPYL